MSAEGDLRAELTEALVGGVGVNESMARVVVDSVIACLRGRRVYVPQARRVYPVAQIRAALESGVSMSRVARRFDVSRATLFRMFPGGLPGNGD